MGKRELVILAVFVVVGVVAFRLAAPPSGDTQHRLSFDRLSDIWQRHGPAALASVSSHGTLAVAADLTSVRLSGFSTVDVRGETRDDVAWTLTVDASGRDESAATAAAEAAALQHDDLGDIAAISLRSTGDARLTSALVLHVPSRLAIRVEGARQTTVVGVSAVRLENVVGDTSVRMVHGLVDGTHHNGELTLEDVGAVRLTLVSSEAVLRSIRGASTVNARNGEARLEQFTGSATVEVHNQRLSVTEPSADIRISGVNSVVAIERPRQATEVDVRQTHVTLALDRVMPATVFTTDAQVDVTLAPALPVELDVVSESGTIDAATLGVAPVITDGGSRLHHAIGRDARVTVRAQRSAIVIVAGK